MLCFLFVYFSVLGQKGFRFDQYHNKSRLTLQDPVWIDCPTSVIDPMLKPSRYHDHHLWKYIFDINTRTGTLHVPQIYISQILSFSDLKALMLYTMQTYDNCKYKHSQSTLSVTAYLKWTHEMAFLIKIYIQGSHFSRLVIPGFPQVSQQLSTYFSLFLK